MIELDPQAKVLLDKMAASAKAPPSPYPDDASWVMAARAAHRGIVALSGPPEAVASIEDRRVPGPGGPLTLRLYRPEGSARRGALVYCHGGGFVSGGLDTHDAPLRAVANRARQAVVAVDFRLAPEHPFPAALEDCIAALTWTAANATALAIDPARIALGGDSTGGTLAVAAALSVRARDGGPRPARLILIYPNTDLTADRAYASITTRALRPSWREDMERYFRAYVPAGVDRRQGVLSPVYAAYGADFPPTWIALAEADPLFDEGQRLAEVMAAAGVRVATSVYRGMIHGFFQMVGALDAGRQLIDDVAAILAAP